MSLTDLGPELTGTIASFLEPRSIIALNTTSMAVNRNVPFRVSEVRQLAPEIEAVGAHRTGHIPVKCVDLGDLNQVHTASVRCEWWDQGWGNYKGRIWIVALPASIEDRPLSELSLEERLNLEGGRIVYSSPIAPRQRETLTINFSPKMEENYHLWYEVGGGGGHKLFISNLRLKTLVFILM
mmetsp:Transcript_29779/g.63766  ORF Transcript_29779/g.63766 Transcript_29779/m.63766 type:complete len:182 (-) Transcript_29779:141-686(-)|eukprot:CAMPEP_0201123844 /NCGR_PEP_ID=MMETSP0850-20130426/9129_1 /ASSEMBLY_ACC=CAM_ASM_000622 /TAXON_ID=183588 /ORGANISM="Pseudo-nitzschia fraudulenta, Strain WWA7" /LENGTH=181 /DNA_ID=CAMNT_0047390939 /DNA_START=64 /DNA_END=609 /DNA_ORIENTATION=-